MFSGIYAIINIYNNKLYIGSANNIRLRWNGHRSQLERNKHYNKHLQYAWNKYGSDAFIFTVIQYTEWLQACEQYWIDKLNVTNDKFGYNIGIVAGSPLGLKRSAETKAKIGAATKGRKASEETKHRMSVAQKGKKRSAEARARMSAARKGQVPTENQRLAVSAANKKRVGVRYNKIRKWPHEKGNRCKCEKCRPLRNLYTREYKRKRKGYYDPILLTKAPLSLVTKVLPCKQGSVV